MGAISVGDMSNEQALAACEALRDLKLPKWLLAANPELQKLSARRIEAFVAALGADIQTLWAKQDPSLGARSLLPSRSRLWVNHGLRATFKVVCAGEEHQIKLESHGFQYASVVFGAAIDGAKIIEVHSKVQPDYIERTPELAIAPAPAPAPAVAPSVPSLDLAALPSVPTKTDDNKDDKDDKYDKDDKDDKDLELVQKLEHLNKMGFGTPRANHHALVVADGSLEVAVDLLLTSDYSMVEADGDGAVEVAPPSYTSQ